MKKQTINLKYHAYPTTAPPHILIKTTIYPCYKRASHRSDLLSASYKVARVATNATPCEKPITPSTGLSALRYSNILISVLPSSLYRL